MISILSSILYCSIKLEGSAPNWGAVHRFLGGNAFWYRQCSQLKGSARVSWRECHFDDTTHGHNAKSIVIILVLDDVRTKRAMSVGVQVIMPWEGLRCGFPCWAIDSFPRQDWFIAENKQDYNMGLDHIAVQATLYGWNARGNISPSR